jgi:hypothetical protein
MAERYWIGPVPDTDDFGLPITDTFVDGATVYGPWGFMNPTSFMTKGRGLGTGRGQKYRKQPDGRWLKVGG